MIDTVPKRNYNNVYRPVKRQKGASHESTVTEDAGSIRIDPTGIKRGSWNQQTALCTDREREQDTKSSSCDQNQKCA